MVRRFTALVVVGWLMAATTGSASGAPEAPAHCGFLTNLAQFDLGLQNLGGDDAARRNRLIAAAGHLRQEIRERRVAAAFSELEAMRVEAFLAAQQRAVRMSGDAAAALRRASAEHPMPWRGQALAQKLALCDVEGSGVLPIETGVGTGDQGGEGGDSALTGQLRIPVGSEILQSNLFALLILALGTICMAMILRGVLGQEQRRSRRVYCYVPVIYSTGTTIRSGWLLDLSCHGCKLQTHGESWEPGTRMRIGARNHELSGTVIWTNRYYAGIDLQPALAADEFDSIVFSGASGPQAAR